MVKYLKKSCPDDRIFAIGENSNFEISVIYTSWERQIFDILCMKQCSGVIYFQI